MIKVSGLGKAFGTKIVLRGLNIEVAAGEIVGLVGVNGAGKTTLLRILATLANPSVGKVQVADFYIPEDAGSARARLGYVGHKRLLYEDLSAQQNLLFYARLFGLKEAETRVAEVLELVKLHSRMRDPVRIYSRGMQQRLAIGRAILHQPKVLLLDEAHSGLDQESAGLLSSLLTQFAENGGSILMASHDLKRVAEIAHRVDIISGGQIAASRNSKEINADSIGHLYAQVLDAEGAARSAS